MVSGISGANFSGRNTCVGPSGEFAGREALERNSRMRFKEIARGDFVSCGRGRKKAWGFGGHSLFKGEALRLKPKFSV